MKIVKDILFLVLLMLCFIPNLVNADVAKLDYSYDKLVKLGNEATYTFFVDIEHDFDYSFTITYDKQFLELVNNNSCVGCGAVAPTPTTLTFEDGKITVKHSKVSGVNGPISLTFKTLKEGNTKIEVIPSSNTNFSVNGAPQEFDIQTEIINVNAQCPECEKCTVCETCETCKTCDEDSNNMVLYIITGASLIVALSSLAFTIVKLKKGTINE